MGKPRGGNKRAFRKDPVATKVVGVKKTKTKAIVSSLKKMNFQTKNKTEAVDAQFESVQLTLASKPKATQAAKAEAKKVLQKQSKKGKAKQAEEEPDVDMAADEMSKLAS